MNDDLYPFQKQILMDIEAYSPGKSAGEMTVMMAGRNMGKSVTISAQKALRKLMEDLVRQQPLTDLILSEGKVFGARYYTIEPVGGDWKEMEEWCKQAFGEPAEIWDAHNFMWPEVGRWYMNGRRFWFRTEKDRDWFVIRWRS